MTDLRPVGGFSEKLILAENSKNLNELYGKTSKAAKTLINPDKSLVDSHQ
ncbi:MAG: hypothetical protein PVH32_05420 [Chromatiales bacterium]|jgi:hypothetical protein